MISGAFIRYNAFRKERETVENEVEHVKGE